MVQLMSLPPHHLLLDPDWFNLSGASGTFDIDSDHFPVVETLKLKLKRMRLPHNKRFIPSLSLEWK